MTAFKPFADDTKSIGVGDLSAENGTSTISIGGSLDIAIDKRGLRDATALRDLAQSIVDALQGRDLPDVAPPEKVENGSIKSPFE